MIKRHVVMIASLSGIFGIMMGILMASWAWLDSNATFARTGAVAKTEANIERKVQLLEHLRSGRYSDATRQLEAWLDNDLVGAAEFARDGTEFSVDTLRAVEVERKARRISGYDPPNANVSAAVQETFRIASQSETGARATPVVSREDVR